MALASESKEVIVLKQTQKKDFSYVMKSLFAGGEASLAIANILAVILKNVIASIKSY